MARKGGKKTTKKGGKKMAKKAMRANRAEQYARAKQTLVLQDDNFNNIFILDDVNLSQFDRLSAIAQCYQFYRINTIEMKFKPYQDTFFSGNVPGSGAGAVPYFHYLIDTGEVQVPLATTGFNQLRDSGAKPIRFDDKTITVRWKPRVPQATPSDSSATPTTTWAMASKKSPWLPTNNAANADPLAWVASKVPHKGIYYGTECSTPGANANYGLEITVSVEFKKPLAFGEPNESGIAIKKEVVARQENLPVVVPV